MLSADGMANGFERYQKLMVEWAQSYIGPAMRSIEKSSTKPSSTQYFDPMFEAITDDGGVMEPSKCRA
jgi:hypothetical protein